MKIAKIISVIIIVIAIIGLIIYGFTNNGLSIDKDITYIKTTKKIDKVFDDVYNHYVVINNRNQFDKFLKDVDFEPDFNNYKYVYFYAAYDNCSESQFTPTSYKIKDNTLTVKINYRRDCGLCSTDNYAYYIIAVNKKEKFDYVNFNYNPINDPHCDPNVSYKPLIYLYPTSEMNVNVQLGNINYITHTYPKYNNDWNVYAYPNGKLIDNKTGRELYGLYWEGDHHKVDVTDEGFVVKGEDTATFLEEKLSLLGLTEREADEFIIYWLPKMENNNYNYIRFETLDEINNYMPLNITPKPDTVIRVLMDYKPLNEKIDVKEQKLITPVRYGFTVVEWGGSIIQ